MKIKLENLETLYNLETNEEVKSEEYEEAYLFSFYIPSLNISRGKESRFALVKSCFESELHFIPKYDRRDDLFFAIDKRVLNYINEGAHNKKVFVYSGMPFIGFLLKKKDSGVVEYIHKVKKEVISNQQKQIIDAFESSSVVAITNGHSVGVSHTIRNIIEHTLLNRSFDRIHFIAPSKSAFLHELHGMDVNLKSKINLITSSTDYKLNNNGLRENKHLFIFSQADSYSDKYRQWLLSFLYMNPESKVILYDNPTHQNPSLLKEVMQDMFTGVTTDGHGLLKVTKLQLSTLNHENVKAKQGDDVYVHANPLNKKWIYSRLNDWATEITENGKYIAGDLVIFDNKVYKINKEFKNRILGIW